MVRRSFGEEMHLKKARQPLDEAKTTDDTRGSEGIYCPLRGMGEKPSPLGEDFSRPAGPETRQLRSARRLGCCPINTVRDKGFFLGGGENRIHSGEL